MSWTSFFSRMQNQKLQMILVILLFCLAYLPAWKTPFLMDDSHTISNNQFVHSLKYWDFAWTSAKAYSATPDNYGYRPVNTNFNQILWALGDGSPIAFQIAKKLLLILFAWVVLLLWRQWSKTVWARPLDPLCETLLFGFLLLHPLCTQVANYVAASSSLLCGLFYSASLYFYLKFRSQASWLNLVMAGAMFFLAIMSKEEGITLIGVIALIEFFYLRSRSSFLPLAVFALIAAFAAYLIVSHFEPSSDIARGVISRSLYFATQLRAYFHYIGLYIFPIDLNFDNLDFRFATELLNLENAIYLFLNLVLVLLGLYLCWRKNVFGLLLLAFYIAISPASSVIPLAEAVNDHRPFLSFIFFGFGLVLALNQAGKKWIHSSRHRILAMWLLFFLMAGMTLERNFDFISGKALWLDTVLKNPHSPRAKNNLALEYMIKADYPMAHMLLQKCTEEAPGYSTCFTNLGIVNSAVGDMDLPDKAFQRAIELDKAVISSRLFYSSFLIAHNRWKEAEGYLIEADRFASGLNEQVRKLLDLVQSKLKEQLKRKSGDELGEKPGEKVGN